MSPHPLVSFGSYEADLDSRELRKRGIRIGLRQQSFDVLSMLLQRPGQVITREDLRRLLWHDDVFVNFESNLNAVVAHLRQVLGDSAAHPRFIETLPKRGYRFLGQIEHPVAQPQSNTARPRLLVLPFINGTGDPGVEYLIDALTDDVITALAALAPEHLAVIARTTAMRYKGTHKDVSRIARELNVDYVLEGGTRRTNNHFVINVQLIQAGDQSHLFAQRYDADLESSFPLQDIVAEEVAAHIPALSACVRPQPLASKPTQHPGAYTEYLKARHEMWKVTPEGMANAKRHFEAALEQDPNFALACVGIAGLYGYLGFWGFLSPVETEPIRRFYAQRAYELDPTLAESNGLLAYRPEKSDYARAYSYHWRETERQMSRARDLNPNSPLLRWWHASVLIVLGRVDEAISELERALELDPLSPEVHFWLVIVLFLARRSSRAAVEAQQLIQLEPAHPVGYMVLGLAYLGAQRYPESIAALRRAADLSGEFPLVLGWLGLSLGLGRHKRQARALLERLRVTAKQAFVLPSSFAWVHLGLGEFDDAFAWIDRAATQNDQWVHPLNSYPFVEPIRDDPRFLAVLRKMNVVDEPVPA